MGWNACEGNREGKMSDHQCQGKREKILSDKVYELVITKAGVRRPNP